MEITIFLDNWDAAGTTLKTKAHHSQNTGPKLRVTSLKDANDNKHLKNVQHLYPLGKIKPALKSALTQLE